MENKTKNYYGIKEILMEKKDEIFTLLATNQNDEARKLILTTLSDYRDSKISETQKEKCMEAIMCFEKANNTKLMSLLTTYLTTVSISKNSSYDYSKKKYQYSR